MSGGWVSFKLGRPGFEYTFDLNPEAISIDESAISILQRNLSGGMLKSVITPNVPTIRINSNFLSLTQRNQFTSLVSIDDTFLSFIVRDSDFSVVLQRLIPVGVSNQIFLPPSSITRLSDAVVTAGGSSVITITGLFATPDEGGSNLWTPGTYNDATREVAPATPLSTDADVFISYTYPGWLVNLQKMTHTAKGGWVDRFEYDFELVGA